MKKITEAARSVDVILETDVLVVGSGPGGLAAALAAARAGARTALIDRNGCFGGNITQVGVEGFAWYRHEQDGRLRGHRHRVRGARQGDGRRHARAAVAQSRARCGDVQVGGRRAGARRRASRRCCTGCASRRSWRTASIRGVITESKAGREAILAKRVIDATGDADIAARAGAPYHKTPKEKMMAASVMFSMSGVNKQRFIEAVKADPQTYADWSGNGEWDYETTGKEDKLFSPFLRKPFKQALEAGSSRPTCTPSPAPGARSPIRAI